MTFDSDALLAGLNPAQQEAALTGEGPVLILAGAGSGKTRAVTHRIARLIGSGEASPREILAVTFTNKAAGELRSRLEALLGEQGKGVWAMTFHALCARMLRMDGSLIGLGREFSILDQSDAQRVVKECLKSEGEEEGVERRAKQVLRVISLAKNRGWESERLQRHDPQAGRIWEEYSRRLRAMQALDFDDLLLRAVELLQLPEAGARWSSRFRFVHVDEYQDVNGVQSQLLALLCPHRNLCVVGDVQQCQPAGSMVRTGAGEVDIARLDPAWHRVFPHQRGEQSEQAETFQLASREYGGELIRVSAGGRETECTPGHRWEVCWERNLPASRALYLSRQGGEWWLGEEWMRGSESLPEMLGKADALWLLRALPSEAGEGESLPARTHISEARALTLLKRFQRREEYPLFHPESRPSGLFPVAACNLMEGLMRVPVSLESAPERLLYQPFQLSRRAFRGRVYSLQVEGRGAYIVDGLGTLNSIYSWRGSEASHILRFREQWPGAQTIELDANYRSQANIIEAANHLMRGTEGAMRVRAVRPAGEPVRLISCPSPGREAWLVASEVKAALASGLSAERLAVIYRANFQSRAFEEVFAREGIAYRVIGGVQFYRREEVQSLRAWAALAHNPRNPMALRRLVAAPRRGVGETSLLRLEESARELESGLLEAIPLCEGLSGPARRGLEEISRLLQEASSAPRLSVMLGRLLLSSGYHAHLKEQGGEGRERLENLEELINQAARFDRLELPLAIEQFLEQSALASGQPGEPGEQVNLMTMHATKGLEFARVWAVGLEDELFCSTESSREEDEEARRLLYVALTRAEDGLTLTYCRERARYGESRGARPLRYLSNLPESVKKLRLLEPETARARGRLARGAGAASSPRPPARERASGRERAPGREAGRARATPPPPGGWQQGMRVAHPRWGEGQIMEVKRDRMRVSFADSSRELIMGAPLTLLT